MAAGKMKDVGFSDPDPTTPESGPQPGRADRAERAEPADRADRAERAARAAGAVRRGGAATGRATVRGARAGARFIGQGTKQSTRRFRSFAGADGASETGLARLTELQAVTTAGDTAFTISLASTVLALPTGQARGQVAVFLLTTMAPFVILAPLIGPILDRYRHGRRWAIGSTLALRAFLSWVLAGLMASESYWLLPVALVCLLAARAYQVTTAAATPLVLPQGITLVTANSRQSIASIVGMVLGTAVAAPLGRIGTEWSLRFAFLVYVVATVLAITLPAQVDSPAAPDERTLREALMRRHRVLVPASVRSAQAAVTGARLLSGFLTLFVGFLLSEHPLDGVPGVVAIGLVIGAAGLGNAAGSFLGNRLGDRSPNRVAAAMMLLATIAAVLTALFYSLPTLLLLGLVTGVFAQLAGLCLDALIQHDIAEDVQSRVFSQTETRLQAAWVIGGGIGISLPLIPGLGFGIISLLMLASLVATVRTLRVGRPA